MGPQQLGDSEAWSRTAIVNVCLDNITALCVLGFFFTGTFNHAVTNCI